MNTEQPAPVKSRVKIPRWEYLTMSYNYSYGSTTYLVNGEKEGRLKNTPLHETLTIFGQQGWELVGIAGAEAKMYVFKRPAISSSNGKH